MELIHHLAARHLVQPVDILGNHRLELARPLQLGQLLVGGVGLGVQAEHLVPVKPVEIPGVSHKIGMAENGLRRLVVLLAV